MIPMSAFPPVAQEKWQPTLRLMLAVYATVFSQPNALYISTPITTGARYYEWLRTGGDPSDKAAYEENVILPNTEAALKLGVHIQANKKERRRLLEPCVIGNIEGFKQDDYLDFWEQVIRRFVGTLRFCPGWEYSNGCVYEFLCALRYGRSCQWHTGWLMNPRAGVQAIEVAICNIEKQGGTPAFLKQCVAEIKSYDTLPVMR